MTPRAPRGSAGRRGPSYLVVAGVLSLAGLATYLVASQRGAPTPPGRRTASRPTATACVHTYPHDPDAFTQGLVFRDGLLYESTGLNGKSSLRKVRLETGDVIQQVKVDEEYFAEGLTDWHDALVQLTWKARLGFVYDLSTFARRRTFRYAGEGWGLTHDTSRLIMSDGSSALRFLDPETLQETGRLSVTEDGRPVENLNELEVVKGQIFANVWQTDDIVIVSPANGHVTGRLSLAGLRASLGTARPVDVLNGIAYDTGTDRLFVTGKLWPTLFEIRIGPT